MKLCLVAFSIGVSVGLLSLSGCGGSGSSCVPTEDLVCSNGKVYKLDSCGKILSDQIIKDCEGKPCNAAGTDCSSTGGDCDPACDLVSQTCSDTLQCKCKDGFSECLQSKCCKNGTEACRNRGSSLDCCTTGASKVCEAEGNGKIYSVDSCGNKENPIQDCTCGCNDAKTDCKSCQTCDPACDTASQDCSGTTCNCKTNFDPCVSRKCCDKSTQQCCGSKTCCVKSSEVCCGDICCPTSLGCNAQGNDCSENTGSDNADFVSENIPDGTEENPGATFDKWWELKNTGTSTWSKSAGYSFRFYPGGNPIPDGSTCSATNMSTVSKIDLGDSEQIAPQANKKFTVSMKAPAAAGTYVNCWKMYHNDTPFGDRVWVQIVVKGGCTPQTPCGQKCCGKDDCNTPCAYDCTKDSKVCNTTSCQCESSGTCSPPCDTATEQCVSGSCQCKYEECTDGCCPSGQVCNSSDKCCTKNCSSKCCGSDGCGGTCPDNCGGSATCNPSTCTCQSCNPACDPNTQQCVNGSCQCKDQQCGTTCCKSGEYCCGTACCANECCYEQYTHNSVCCSSPSMVCGYDNECCTPSCMGGWNCGDDYCGQTNGCGTCSGSTPICLYHKCVQCTDSLHCLNGQICDTNTNTCVWNPAGKWKFKSVSATIKQDGTEWDSFPDNPYQVPPDPFMGVNLKTGFCSRTNINNIGDTDWNNWSPNWVNCCVKKGVLTTTTYADMKAGICLCILDNDGDEMSTWDEIGCCTITLQDSYLSAGSASFTGCGAGNHISSFTVGFEFVP